MASKDPIPPIITLIQYWLDEVQYLPGFFTIKDERVKGYPEFNEWEIGDTLPGMRNYIRFNATKMECHFGNDIKFSVHDPRFFEKLDWFLAGKWDMILDEWPL